MSKELLVGCHRSKSNDTIFENNSSRGDSICHEFKINDSSITISNMNALDFTKTIKEDIHLVFTSPPYNCNIKYDSYEDSKTWNEYKEMISAVFSECYERMANGARIVVNVPIYVRDNSKRVILTSVYDDILNNSGFEIIDLITWVKAKSSIESVGVAGRSTAWGSWMSPTSPYSRPITEVVLVAKKQGKFIADGIVDITKDEFKEFTTSAWFVNSKTSKEHPAMFPPELPLRAIKLYSCQGHNVFDPFMGIGNTGIACIRSKRNFFGCDISSNYISIAKRKLVGERNENVSYQKLR